MGRTIIIGGGAIGLSVAYHLARRGARDVHLLERNSLTSGTSWHAAGIVGPLRATPGMTRLAAYALELFPRLEQETGLSTGYRRTEGYWLARAPERLDELRRICALGRTQGLTPRMIAAQDVPLPQLDLAGHAGALHVPEDGHVNPVDLCMVYARAARAGGVDIRENCGVAAVTRAGGRATGVTLGDGSHMAADRVILCTGAWSRALADAAGAPLPLQAVEHMYVVTAPIPGLPTPFPVIRDLDSGIYLKGDAGKLVIGGFEPDAKCWDATGPEGDRPFLELPEDWAQFTPFMAAALNLMPGLADAGIQHFMNGPESFTADTRPLVGQMPHLDGLFVAAGMNSVGVMSSAGIGRALADWALDGAPPHDLWEVDVARCDPRSAHPDHMQARMAEAVADLFALHWPHKQPGAGRGLRKSPLHDRWAAAGAVFGLTAGWERGLWYARDGGERALPYSVTAPQPWQAIATREAAQMTTGAALLDLTPFTKLRVCGPDALSGLNFLSTAQLDRAPGRAIYTQLLNPRGGIEMDVTVTRSGDACFELTSGAATRWRDLAWLRRTLPEGTRIEDRTEAFCVIGLMGHASRAMLGGQVDGLPFAHRRTITLAGRPCSATRLSYVGAPGYEITVANADAPAVFDALYGAGAAPMGHYALEACRIEKGFVHWGHDIGPDVTPLQAGLGHLIDWSRDFQGKAALQAQRGALTRRLMLMELSGTPLMLHDEPVFEGDRWVGLTTSGGIGARSGRTLAFAMTDVAPGETRAQTSARRFTIEVAGLRHDARPCPRPPHDPDGTEMRA